MVAGSGTVLSLAQLRRERRAWRVQMKTTWALELHKARLVACPAVFEILRQLSKGSAVPATAATAARVAAELNDWLYSAGGMAADATTRGAVAQLRNHCRLWARDGDPHRPPDLYGWRDQALLALRRDLDLPELQTFDLGPESTMLKRLEADLL